MKGGGSRLNVNTDKPHSLISIKNKVLPTSPPARQSPQAPPTAARARRSGEREPRAARGAAPPPSGRAAPAARPPPPPRRAERPAGHLAPRPRHALREPALRASSSPRARAALRPPASARFPRLPESPFSRGLGASAVRLPSVTFLALGGSGWHLGLRFAPSGANEK